jgi:23S rRNA pseudouridine1911/1915/1917 synthase
LDRLAGKGFSARPAETHYEVTRRFRDHTLVEVRLVTGVMHQIRAHFAHLGHAVVGDAQYGGEAGARFGLARHFLHASRLGLEAPGGGARVEAESPMPPELTVVLDALPVDGD